MNIHSAILSARKLLASACACAARLYWRALARQAPVRVISALATCRARGKQTKGLLSWCTGAWACWGTPTQH